MLLKVTLLLSLALLVGASSRILDAQTHASTRDGVYTSQQAARGQDGYAKACASCHGETLEGTGQTPPLVGADFTPHWSGQPLDELFEKIQSSMPGDRPGRLSRAENADILAYLLKVNKFPAGETPLSSSADGLKQIQFDDPPASK